MQDTPATPRISTIFMLAVVMRLVRYAGGCLAFTVFFACGGGARPEAPAQAGGIGGGFAGATAGSAGSAGTAGSTVTANNYDQLILSDAPVAYWAMHASSETEADLTGHGHSGSYLGGAPTRTKLPNGDDVAVFDGVRQYLSVPSHAAFSITTTGTLTWEGWIRPDVLQFPNDGGGGYVDWMGKCAEYAPSCEWEARMYSTTNDQNRCNRFSAYVFNPSAGLGSGADFQPTCGLIQAGHWYHVVGEYTLLTQPADCQNSATYPGAIDIWVNGVKWNHSKHGQTGCLSQYKVLPKSGDSPVNIGSMALDSWFRGAIGKVALYDKLLTTEQISAHYRAMTGEAPHGSCADTCTF